MHSQSLTRCPRGLSHCQHASEIFRISQHRCSWTAARGPGQRRHQADCGLAPGHAVSCRSASQSLSSTTETLGGGVDLTQWQHGAAGVLEALQLSPATTPHDLWQHLASRQQPLADHPQLKLDLVSCRLLLSAAAATCKTQQQHNQLVPLFQAVLPVLPSFELQDFRQLLQLCAQARYVPDTEWLASIYYADTGGFERFYKQEPPESLVQLLSDLAAMLGSMQALLQQIRQHTALLQQLQQHSDSSAPASSSASSEQLATGVVEATANCQHVDDVAAELSALQAALQQGSAHLVAIQKDALLAGELSAVGGYWLLRRLLPAVQDKPVLSLQGVCALRDLGYQVLDSEDADALLGVLTLQVQAWSPTQLAAAVTASLPCLGEVAPTEGQQLAVLFAATGAAAGGLSPSEAAQVLMVVAQLPGYAPDAQVAQSLLTAALQPPLQDMTARQLYQLLQAAAELGAVPSGSQLQAVQSFLGT